MHIMIHMAAVSLRIPETQPGASVLNTWLIQTVSHIYMHAHMTCSLLTGESEQLIVIKLLNTS